MIRFPIAILVTVGTGFILWQLALSTFVLQCVICGLAGFGVMAVIK